MRQMMLVYITCPLAFAGALTAPDTFKSTVCALLCAWTAAFIAYDIVSRAQRTQSPHVGQKGQQ